jgi:hypothetical protein
MKVLALILTVGMLAVAGCVVGGGDIAKFDNHAAVMRGLADKVNGSTVVQMQDPNAILSDAFVTENEARSSENFSNGLHMKAPKWATNAVRPTTLPWTPKEANGQ